MPLKLEAIFVLGGPGAGKGTQCKLLAKKYDLCHISIGDVLRAELGNPDSEWAPEIRANMAEGRVGPPSMTVRLLIKVMNDKHIKENVSAFLIDGE